MSMAELRILGVGDSFRDTTVVCADPGITEKLKLVKGSSHRGNDRKSVEEARQMAINESLSWTETAGGSASNALKVIAQLGGHDVTLCTLIANDEDGNKAAARLNELGIKLLNVESKGVNPEDKTGIVTSYVTQEKDGTIERTMLTYQDIADKFTSPCIKEDYFEGRKFVVLDGYNIYHARMQQKCIELAINNDCKTIMGLPSPKTVSDFKESLIIHTTNIDFCFGNREEFKALVGVDNPKDVLDHYEDHQTVVMTDGANGSYVKWKGTREVRHFEALIVDGIKDTIGAGDFYLGGFMVGVMADKTIEECVGLGNMAASSVIQEYGADLPPEKWTELKERARHILEPDVNAQLSLLTI